MPSDSFCDLFGHEPIRLERLWPMAHCKVCEKEVRLTQDDVKIGEKCKKCARTRGFGSFEYYCGGHYI